MVVVVKVRNEIECCEKALYLLAETGGDKYQ